MKQNWNWLDFFSLIRTRNKVVTTGLLQINGLLKSVTIKPSVMKCKNSTYFLIFYICFDIKLKQTYFIIAYHFYRLACHSVYAPKLTGKSVCVVADDTDVFILLLHVSISCNETLYFRQGTTSSRDGITFHNVTSLSSQLGEKICDILPAFHSLTGSNFTKPFFGRSNADSCGQGGEGGW